jgi:hypothetical protein
LNIEPALRSIFKETLRISSWVEYRASSEIEIQIKVNFELSEYRASSEIDIKMDRRPQRLLSTTIEVE